MNKSALAPLARRIALEASVRTPLRAWALQRYRYLIDPSELCFLVQCLETLRNVPGDIVEVGVARGATTVFLNRHMDVSGIEKRYHAIDTFSGFVADDVSYETSARGKSSRDDKGNSLSDFKVNSRHWFDKTLEINNIRRVKVHQGDVSELASDFSARVCLAFIDVDLYLPTKRALRKVSSLMQHGYIVVHDCVEDNLFDGSYQAYREFIADCGVEATVVGRRLGVIRFGDAPWPIGLA